MECCNVHKIISDFYSEILFFVKSKIKDSQKAEDITQEVMGRLIDAYNKQIRLNNIKAWLYKVTNNIITDNYRIIDIIEYSDQKLDVENTQHKFELKPEDFILTMIKCLPKEYSLPLIYSDIEKMKHKEIANKMDLSLSNVKVRIQRARKKLYDLFLECCDIEYSSDGNFMDCTIKKSCTDLNSKYNQLKNNLLSDK